MSDPEMTNFHDPALEMERLVNAVLNTLETDAGENTDASLYFAVLTTCLCAGAVQSNMPLEHLLEGIKRTYYNLKAIQPNTDQGVKQ